MKSVVNYLSACFMFDIKSDPLVKAFEKICFSDTDCECFEAYSVFCETLLSEDKSLSQYLYDLLAYGKHRVMERCAAAPTELQRKGIEFDIMAVKRFSEYNSEKLKAEMSDRCDSEMLKMLPDYEQGTFNYTADYFIEHYAKYGSGMFARYKAYTFDGEQLNPIENTDPIRLSDLKNYEVQRNQVVENTLCFVSGKPAQDVLLYGDRGTGKSSTIKALLNEFDSLRIVEVSKSVIAELPMLFRMLSSNPLKFIVMIDDLTFSADDDRFGVLKAVLEGGVAARPENVLIYATTNRRRLIKDNAAEHLGDNGANADAVDESMSLSDRFGLFVTFERPDRRVYLDIVNKLAADSGIDLPEEQLFAAAERFALRRNGRSPRTAKQFIEYISAHIDLGLEY